MTWRRLIILLAVICTSIAAHADPLPPLEPITPENIDRLVPLATVGRGAAQDIQWHPSGDLIAVASATGVWLYTPEWETVAHYPDLSRLRWNHDGTLAAVSDVEGWHVYPFAGTALDRVPRISFDPGTRDVRWHPSADILAEQRDFSLQLRDAAAGHIMMHAVPAYRLLTWEWSPSGDRIAVWYGSMFEGHGEVWNADTGEMIASLGQPREDFSLRGLNWHGDDDVFGWGFYARDEATWDAATGEVLTVSEPCLSAMGYCHKYLNNQRTISPDGTLVASLVRDSDGGDSSYITIDRIADGTQVWYSQFDGITSMVWAPDSTSFVGMNHCGILTVRRLGGDQTVTGESLAPEFTAHRQYRNLRWDSTGTRLAAWGNSSLSPCSVTTWDVASLLDGTPPAFEVTVYIGSLGSLYFTRDGLGVLYREKTQNDDWFSLEVYHPPATEPETLWKTFDCCNDTGGYYTAVSPSPDFTMLALGVWIEPDEGPAISGVYDTATQAMLFSFESLGDPLPYWSPDGSRLALVSAAGTDGSIRHIVIWDAVERRKTQQYWVYGVTTYDIPRWATDRLTFLIPQDNDIQTMWVIDTTHGQSAIRLTQNYADIATLARYRFDLWTDPANFRSDGTLIAAIDYASGALRLYGIPR